MTGWELLKTAWHWEPSVVAGCALILGAYLVAIRFRVDRPALFFAGGVLGVFLVLVSPLDPLGDDYLFSAHMVQHIFLDMICPMFFVLGIPLSLAIRLFEIPFFSRLERIVGNPVVCLLLGNFTLCVWHLPVLFDAALASERVHIFQHLTFLVTGTMLWWPVFNPIAERRLLPLQSVVYLSFSAMINGLLGIVLTIPSVTFYSGYAHPDDELGALSLIRNTWKLDQLADQQLGGAIMWVVGSTIYIWAIMVMVVRWYKATEKESYGKGI